MSIISLSKVTAGFMKRAIFIKEECSVRATNNYKGIYSMRSAPANGEAKENKKKTQPPHQPTYDHANMKLTLPSLQP
jgi:hypothetical protein